MYDYILKNNIDLKYSGIDINPIAIQHAKEKHKNISFTCEDIMNVNLEKSQYPDYTLVVGMFNLLDSRIKNKYEYIQTALKKMVNFSKKGVAITFRTSPHEGVEDHLNFTYYDPERLFKYALELSPYVSCNHSFSKYTGALYIYK